MKTSVILCTYNRCELLSRALDSVLNSELPESFQWELLVVDNNSSDKTKAVVDSYRVRFPNLRYIFEARQGKSHALNRGLREAKGEILAFMDDDVQVDPQWLSKISAPFHAGPWAGVGGRILSKRLFSACVVALSWSIFPWRNSRVFRLWRRTQRTDGAAVRHQYGLSKSIFEKYGAFRLDLGPCPGTEIRGEDTEFGRRILKAGERLWYEPDAVVYHEVPKNRLDKRYFQRFLYDHGRASIREKKIGQPVFLFRGSISRFRRLSWARYCQESLFGFSRSIRSVAFSANAWPG